jgi:hypothetical protein
MAISMTISVVAVSTVSVVGISFSCDHGGKG